MGSNPSLREDSEGEGEELVYRKAWSTGSVVHTGVAQPVGAAADLKAKGNAARAKKAAKK